MAMKANHDTSLRLSFDQFAELYDSARPRIGRLMTSDIMRFAEVDRGTRVLDVGAGTGQWIDGLLHYGCRVDALEPGRAMRTIISNEFGHRGVRVHGGDFETSEFPSSSFGAIVSANAFHWLDPVIAYVKAASILRSGGSIVLVWNFLSSADDDRLKGMLRGVLPTTYSQLIDLIGIPSAADEWRNSEHDEIVASGLFSAPRSAWFYETLAYSSTSFVDLLASYATSAPMDEATRGLIADQLAASSELDLLATLKNNLYVVTAKIAE